MNRVMVFKGNFLITSKSLIFFIIIFMVAFSNAANQYHIYLSPGLQIGYGGDGVFWGGQMTIGAVSRNSDDCECWDPFVPSVSYGIRFYNDYQMRYLDGQLGFIYGGLGFGKVTKIMKSENQLPTEIADGFRFKVWAGVLYYGTWDAVKFPEHNLDFNFGSIVVMPLATGDVSNE